MRNPQVVSNSSRSRIRARARGCILGLGALAFLAGCGDDPAKPSTPPPANSPTAVLGALADAYRTLDFSRFERLISIEPGARFTFVLSDSLSDGTTRWDAESELYVHRRMFEPGAAARRETGLRKTPRAPAAEPGVPPELWLARVTISLVPIDPFAVVANPAELDPERWRLHEATYQVDILFDTQTETDYRVSDRASFGVIEDLSEPGKHLLYRWSEVSAAPGAPEPHVEPAGVEPTTWGRFKSLYAPESPPSTLIEALEDAYGRRDYESFAELFPEEEDGVTYLFILAEPLPIGQTNWDLAEELRIQRRMFRPESPLPGETPVPQELWLSSITITLTPIREFTERPDLYRSPANPNGLDPERWQAVEAEYLADILFDTQSQTDYRVNGRENFVVAARRDRLQGVPGKYVLYRWEDLGSYARIASEASWTSMKALYR